MVGVCVASLLACLHELIPWIRRWHAGASPLYGGEPADLFTDFLRSEAAAMGKTVPDLLTWEPPKKTRTKRVKKSSKRAATKPTT